MLSLFELMQYDRIVLFMSGGKDSLASLLYLLHIGVPKDMIELHHHSIDGDEGKAFMDWECTEAYNIALAKAFDIPLYFSWRDGGFERELMKDNDLSGDYVFEDIDHNVVRIAMTDRAKRNTRRKFPQVTADLRTRWCSAYLKVDVGDRLLRKQLRFSDGRKYLVVTGERAEESVARANYEVFERHRADNRGGKKVNRYIDHCRIVHPWKEEEIWDIIKSFGVNPHPAYYCGWSRTSCMTCIFGSPSQFATIRKYAPERFERIARLENEFGVSIKRNDFLHKIADSGIPYEVETGYWEIANSREYNEPIFIGNSWILPSGAFGENAGPN